MHPYNFATPTFLHMLVSLICPDSYTKNSLPSDLRKSDFWAESNKFYLLLYKNVYA